MATARVPLLDESGRLPDAYAPASVAQDAAAAISAKTAAEAASTGATTAKNAAETARQGAEAAQAAAEESAERASLMSVHATVSPDYPDALRLTFPVYLQPAPHVVRIPIGV
jgi:cytosine/adenosine deaminase-related metal-dependent hydrolase